MVLLPLAICSGAKDLTFDKGRDYRELAVEQGFNCFSGRLRLSYGMARQSAGAVSPSPGAWELAAGIWFGICVDEFKARGALVSEIIQLELAASLPRS